MRPEILRGVRLDRDQLGDRVELGLLLDRDGVLVAEDPGAVVDRLAGVVLVAGLTLRKYSSSGFGRRAASSVRSKRGEHAARGQRAAAAASSGRETLASVKL